MNAEWENARCMHGNRPEICFVATCFWHQRTGGVDFGHRMTTSDLVELQEMNRQACRHPNVARALSPEEEEAEMGAGIMMGRFAPVLCIDCSRIVPTRPAPTRPPRVLSAVP